MNMFKLHTLLFVAMLAANPVFGQATNASAADAPKRPARKDPILSPELQPDGAVTFRLVATNATSVKLTGLVGPEVVMKKDTEGLWSATVPALPAGIYSYSFVVDGLRMIDPNNPAVKPQRWPNTSELAVPANPPAPWDVQDVPHGVLHEHLYHSKALEKSRRIVVYTPPNATGSLPVLYLSHGYSDNEQTWSAFGKANLILDALIARKQALPMMVVMMDAHALPPGGDFANYGPANSAALCRELTEDIVPLVESHYKVKPGPDARAFVGLSMGGHHALTIALNHHDQYHWIGAFSSATPPTEAMAAGLDHPAAVNSDLKLLWIACGKDDFLFKTNNNFDALLNEKGIHHEYIVTEGSHDWPVWRSYLVEIAPKLFR